jgi:hypothetical protein
LRKKIYIVGAVIGGVVFLFLLFTLVDTDNSPKDNSSYVTNERSGTIDFVDPDQTPEGNNNSGILRNVGALSTASSSYIVGELSNRIKEYADANTPQEKAYYILDETIVIQNNRYTFKIESESKETTLSIELFVTRQGTANVYINGEGPFSEFNKYYKLPVEQD